MIYTNRFDQPGFDIKNIVASAYGDVNGDNTRDYVFLTGVSVEGSNFIQDITLGIKEGRTGIKQGAKLKSDAGFSPTLFLGDFTGDKIQDILISIASGGSGGIYFYYIFSDVNNRLKMLFDYEEFNNRYNYKVEYQNYYKVTVKNMQTDTTYIIDISNRGKEYLDEIYTPDGLLKKPIEGWVDPLGGLYPVDYDGNGVYELLGYQGISGLYHADRLGYVQSVLKWNGTNFYLMDQYVAIFGSDQD